LVERGQSVRIKSKGLLLNCFWKGPVTVQMARNRSDPGTQVVFNKNFKCDEINNDMDNLTIEQKCALLMGAYISSVLVEHRTYFTEKTTILDKLKRAVENHKSPIYNYVGEKSRE